MSEESKQSTGMLEERLADSIGEISNWISSMANEQIPLVAEEIITYGIMKHAGGAVITFLVFFILSSILIGIVKSSLKEEYRASEGEGFVFMLVLMLNLFVLSLLAINLFKLGVVIFTPRVFILEYLTNLI